MKNPTISDRLSNMPVSAVRKLAPLAADAKKEGVRVYHLNIGDPDIKTPEVMLDVLKKWEINPIRYAQSPGEPDFLKALNSYYHGLGFNFLNTSQILATVGGSEALLMAFFAVTNPGDEVLVFEPFYSNYSILAKMAGINLISAPTTIENGFHLPPREIIESKITEKTKAILFCTPGNPTGTVYTKEEMDMLVEIAQDKGLFLLSDEVYREFLFVDRPHISLLNYIEQIPDRAIVLDSLSKRYSLCGARLGILITLNEELMKGVIKIAQSRLSGGLIDQVMATKLTEVPGSYMTEVQVEYQKRRDVLYEGLMQIPGVSLAKPEGAFYTMVSLPVANSEDFCIYLLKEYRDKNETVMLAPGAGFYSTPGRGQNEVRIAYVLNTTDLKRCIEIIAEALKQYKNK